MSEYLLSIDVLTYNQAKYIRQCLDGILMQKTNFQFEILVHDDASTDGTAEIIKEYEQKYPEIVKPIYQTENQFSKNISMSRTFQYPRIKGKYVAICEGDDYWTDSYKLQKQVDFLEKHSEYSACFHPVKVIWENGEKKNSIYPSKRKMFGKKFVTKDDLLKTNYIQTNSIVYRWMFSDKDVAEYFPDNILPGDLYLHLLHAQLGNIAFIPDVMAIYRKQKGGIWFDENSRVLKYGLRIVKFYYCVWKNFTDSSEKYLYKQVLPIMKKVSDTYYNNCRTEELETLKKTYGELYSKALTSKNSLDANCKKYKKLFNMFIAISTILLILNIIQFIYYKL